MLLFNVMDGNLLEKIHGKILRMHFLKYPKQIEITSSEPFDPESVAPVDVSMGPGQTIVTLIPFWQSYKLISQAHQC